jgi:branched-subunit amino acid aminotransferase/4-amino-4-deoxychorismate lyase
MTDMNKDKTLNTELETIRIMDRQGRIWDGPRFPMDSDARYTFYSRMGGFVPTEVAADSVFSNPAHYGAGGFEGIRIVRSPHGDGFVDLPHNIARFVYSSLAFDPSLLLKTLKILDYDKVSHISHRQRTPKEFYDDATAASEKGKDIMLSLDIVYKDHSEKRTNIPVRLKVKYGEETKEFSLREIRDAIFSLAYLNNLIRYGPYPETIQQVDGGYFRPVFWVSGEEGLKVPTVFSENGKLISKPLYFAVGTLPWTQYLNERHYEQGLDLLLAPYPRIDSAMPVNQKIAGNYVNSARNINPAVILGFGEILALNHENRAVEGSAENIVLLFENKKSGAMRAYCPPFSSNILPGTTRDRMLRVLENGMQIADKKVEMVMEAPHIEQVINGLNGADWKLSALVMMGTGVGLIHAKSLTINPMLEQLSRIDQLRSEEEGDGPLIMEKPERYEERFEINEGVKHPFVEALQKAYNELVLGESGSRLYLPFDMNPDSLESVMGVCLDEIEGGLEFRRKAESGHFKERINGLKQPDEVSSRHREVSKIVRAMAKCSIRKRTEPKPKPSTIIMNGC